MTAIPLQLADAVQRMLEAEELDPTPVVDFAPTLEREQLTEPKIVVAPGNVLSEVISRSGVRSADHIVQVAVIKAVKPSDRDDVRACIEQCSSIAKLCATKPLEDGDENTLRTVPKTINHEPLYDREKLTAGVFLGVITITYGAPGGVS